MQAPSGLFWLGLCFALVQPAVGLAASCNVAQGKKKKEESGPITENAHPSLCVSSTFGLYLLSMVGCGAVLLGRGGATRRPLPKGKKEE